MSAPYSYQSGDQQLQQQQGPPAYANPTGGGNSFGAVPEGGSLPYLPMPEGYQQFQAPPMPTPGHAGYVAGPQYMMAPEHQQAYVYYPPPQAGAYQPQQPQPAGYGYQMQPPQPYQYAATGDAATSAVPMPSGEKQEGEDGAIAAAAPPPPSVFDVDPSAVKRTAYYTPANIDAAIKPKRYGDLNVAANAPGAADLSEASGCAAGPYPVIGHIITIPFTADSPMMGVPVDTACCRACRQQHYGGRVVGGSAGGRPHGSVSLSPPGAAVGPSGPSIASLDGELFRPCLCASFIHRGCFRESRTGLSVMKSRAYYECPECHFTYKLERIMGGAKPSAPSSSYSTAGSGGMAAPMAASPMGGGDPASAAYDDKARSWLEELGEGNVRRRFFLKILAMWAIAIAVMAAVVAGLAGATYGLDKDNKRIPVFIKMMLSSVAASFPDSEKRDEWREEFRRPDVAVWQYYLAFGIFLSALLLLAFGLISYLACADTNEAELRPSLCSHFCDGDSDREKQINGYIWHRQQQQRGLVTALPAPVQAAVVQREERRSNEIRDHYYRQRKASYWFSCSDNSSYYYYDSRPYYYHRRQNYYDNRYNGQGRHYHSGGYYAGGSGSGGSCTCCDVCLCCAICCSETTTTTSSTTARHSSSSSSSCNCSNCNGCGCSSSDCNCSGCNCSGCDGEGAAGVLVILLVVLLVVAVIIILSAYITLVCYLVSRTVRLAGVASKLAYVQALEEEDHVVCLAINESWRPVGAV